MDNEQNKDFDDLDLYSSSPDAGGRPDQDNLLASQPSGAGARTEISGEQSAAVGALNSEPAEKAELVSLAKNKLLLIKKLAANARDSAEELLRLISSSLPDDDRSRIAIAQIGEEPVLPSAITGPDPEKIVEGVFDGEKMIGPDGKSYNVPANYASKSKLVEGDLMKLTITGSGTFLYKQIGPVERGRVIGVLEKDVSGSYYAVKDEARWRILTASVTYFRGETGDEVIILTPKYGLSGWAAVENIIKKN
jgi:hypothetical protein